MFKQKHLLMVVVIAGVLLFSTVSCQQNSEPVANFNSGYGDLLESDIRGIAPETIEGYLNGAGMGLALPAELNGYPGPKHILEMGDQIQLTSEQEGQIQQLFDEMQPRAIALGEEILAEEAALELAFRDQTLDENGLQTRLQAIGDLQAELRFVHLRTHLSTVTILSEHQIQQYNALRGYAEMPADHQGHDHN